MRAMMIAWSRELEEHARGGIGIQWQQRRPGCGPKSTPMYVSKTVRLERVTLHSVRHFNKFLSLVVWTFLKEAQAVDFISGCWLFAIRQILPHLIWGFFFQPIVLYRMRCSVLGMCQMPSAKWLVDDVAEPLLCILGEPFRKRLLLSQLFLSLLQVLRDCEIISPWISQIESVATARNCPNFRKRALMWVVFGWLWGIAYDVASVEPHEFFPGCFVSSGSSSFKMALRSGTNADNTWRSSGKVLLPLCVSIVLLPAMNEVKWISVCCLSDRCHCLSDRWRASERVWTSCGNLRQAVLQRRRRSSSFNGNSF